MQLKIWTLFSNLYTLYISHVTHNHKYYFLLWGAVPPTTLHLPDTVQKNVIKLVGNRSLSAKLLVPCPKSSKWWSFSFLSILPWFMFPQIPSNWYWKFFGIASIFGTITYLSHFVHLHCCFMHVSIRLCQTTLSLSSFSLLEIITGKYSSK